MVKTSAVLDLIISDHYQVYVVLDMKVPNPSTSQPGVSKTIPLTSSTVT